MKQKSAAYSRRPDSLMILSNACHPDPRVQKEARSLSAQGYRVRILAWDRSHTLPKYETQYGYEIERLLLSERSGNSLRQLMGFFMFWLWALGRGLRLRPRLVHCHDLDVFPAGHLLSLILRIPLLLDAHELYAEMQVGRMPPLVVRGLAAFERYAVRTAGATITVSNKCRDYFSAIRPDVGVVGNWYDPVSINAASASSTRKELGIPEDAFLIAYIGGLPADRNFEPLIAAVKSDPNIFAVVAGKGDQEAKLSALSEDEPQLKYIGFTQQSERYVAASDALYYLFSPGSHYVQFSCSNALGHSVAYRKPLITSRLGETGRIVSELFPDLCLQAPTGEEVVRVVNMLRQPDQREAVHRRLTEAGKERYSWQRSAELLGEVYGNLLARRKDEKRAVTLASTRD